MEDDLPTEYDVIVVGTGNTYIMQKVGVFIVEILLKCYGLGQ
jgi:hypothetical protein